MADRKCSCCGMLYTDGEWHDYEKCVKDCEARVSQARSNLNDAIDCLVMAVERRKAQRDGRI